MTAEADLAEHALVTESVALGDDDEIRAVLEEVCRLTGMGFAAVARVTDRRWITCQLLDRIEFGLRPGDELALKTTICDDIRRCGRAVVIDHVSDDREWRTHPTPMLYGFESYASFPIELDDGSFFGTLCAIDPAPHRVSDVTIVAAMERHAARVGAILSRHQPHTGSQAAPETGRGPAGKRPQPGSRTSSDPQA